METACFITTTRADLIDLTQRLIGAIETGLLTDAQRPLLVSLTGSVQSGKSLVVDTACDLLLADKTIVAQNCLMTCWHGALKGALKGGLKGGGESAAPLAFTHMDLCGWNPYAYKTLQTRTRGGMNFIQNAPHLNNEADIAFCIEHIGVRPSNYKKALQTHYQPHITQHRAQGLLAGDFARFVSVRVNNPVLLQSGVFRAAFAAFAPQPGALLTGPLWKDTGASAGDKCCDLKRAFRNVAVMLRTAIHPLSLLDLPVYGRNFPLEL